MTLAEKIAAARKALVAAKDALTALTTKETQEPEDLTQIEELTGSIEKLTTELQLLEKAEKALAASALPVGANAGAGGGASPGTAAPGVATRGHMQRKPSIDLLVRACLCHFEAYVNHEPLDQVVARRYPSMLDVAEVSKATQSRDLIVKNATDPAMTNVAGWAQELVRETYAAFMDLLAPESVVPRIPMARYTFDGFGKIIIPARRDRDAPNLAAAFRAEGAPIRVSRTTLVKKELTPKSMGIISPFTKELLRRSTPNIEEAIRNWMLEDTGIALDGIYLDNVAGTAIRPAGIQNGIAAGDTAASTGNTAANITEDIRGRLTALAGHNMGRRPVWIMNPAHYWGLTFSRTVTGEPAFPETADGQLAGIPIIRSTTVPMSIVFLVDAAELGFAGGAPTFEGTDVATLHMDDGDPNTNGVTGASVLPIVDGEPATPVRSLFQTHSAAVKAVWEVDWAVMRAGAVQTITGVTW